MFLLFNCMGQLLESASSEVCLCFEKPSIRKEITINQTSTMSFSKSIKIRGNCTSFSLKFPHKLIFFKWGDENIRLWGPLKNCQECSIGVMWSEDSKLSQIIQNGSHFVKSKFSTKTICPRNCSPSKVTKVVPKVIVVS